MLVRIFDILLCHAVCLDNANLYTCRPIEVWQSRGCFGASLTTEFMQHCAPQGLAANSEDEQILIVIVDCFSAGACVCIN